MAGNTVKTVNNILWIPGRGDAFGESFSLGSQMPGDPNDVSDMRDTRIWYNGLWQSFNGTFVFTPPYHYAYGGGPDVVVDDLGCSS